MRKSDPWAAAFLIALAFVLRWKFIYETQFDGLYGQDAYAYFDAADRLAHGHSLGAFFWPGGYPLVLGAAFRLFSTNAAVGQLLNVMAGSVLAGLVYLLARTMRFIPSGSFVSGMIIAVSGQAVQSSVVIMSDIPALFWTVLSVLFLVTYERKRSGHWLILAGIALSAAGITRWLYCCLAVSWGIFALLIIKQRKQWWHCLAACAAGLVLLLPQIIYSNSTPFPVLSHAWIAGWSPHNALSRDFYNVDGHLSYPVSNLIFYTRPLYHAVYLSPIFTPLMLVGVAGLLWKRIFAKAALLITWLIIPLTFLVGIPYQNIRFALVTIPAMALLTGAGLSIIITLLRERTRIRPVRRAVIALIGLACGMGIIHMGLTASQYTRQFIEQQQHDKEVTTWAARFIPEGSTVYSFGLTLALRHYTSLTVLELYNETPASLANAQAENAHTFVLVNPWNLQNQWQGREPLLAFEWLRDERGLRRLARINNFVLYRTIDAAN